VSVYVDASAVLKIYLDEPETSAAEEILTGQRWLSGCHTYVEVRRNLARTLAETPLEEARRRFEQDWSAMDVIDIGAPVATAAAELAERTGLRTLDALHLGAAESVGGSRAFVTFDRRLAEAARSLGWTVLGVE
jgi:predicted nucleic acid-binding protein